MTINWAGTVGDAAYDETPPAAPSEESHYYRRPNDATVYDYFYPTSSS
ncbi:MAG: hypothetical protein QF368_05625 [SAR202 cluster bacterium]|nr:hypothetical protein [SAR202 cluster bacterium]